MRPIANTENYFWVGDGVPTLSTNVPIGATYYNQTGGGSHRFTPSGWVALPDALTDITVAAAAISDATVAGQAMLTAATVAAQKVLLAIPKIYRGLLTQEGTAAPSVVVVENTLSATIVWARSGVGTYTGTLVAAFTSNKTFPGILSAPSPNTTKLISVLRTSADVVTVYSGDGTQLADEILTSTPIEILVYP